MTFFVDMDKAILYMILYVLSLLYCMTLQFIYVFFIADPGFQGRSTERQADIRTKSLLLSKNTTKTSRRIFRCWFKMSISSRDNKRRMNLHSAWRGFLTSAKQWQKYTDLFLQRETTFRQGEHCQGRSGFCQGSIQFLKDRSRCRVQGRCIQSERHRRLGREHDQYFGMRRSS